LEAEAERLNGFEELSQRFSLIPLEGKRPIESGWTKWCSEKRPFNREHFKGKNAGVACGPASGVLVIDVDDEGRFEELLREKGWLLPETFKVLTGTGKPHHYYQYPQNGKRYGNKATKGVYDVRGLGGVVVAPWSIHPETGKLYAVAKHLPIAPPPEWLLALYSEDETASTSSDDDNDRRERPEVDEALIDDLRVSDEIKRLIKEGVPKGDRSEALMKVLVALVDVDLREKLIISIFEVFPIGEKYREKGASGREWLSKQIEKARDHVKGKEKTRGSSQLDGFTAAELLEMEFPEPKWAVPDLIPEGVTLLCGKPKAGKSWLALDVAVAVASGGTALQKIGVEKGRVLYLALEDSQRRLKERLTYVLGGKDPPPDLHFHTRWQRLGEGGQVALQKWLEEHLDTQLVIIDTLAKVRDKAKKPSISYEEDYKAIEGLKDLAERNGLAIMVVHHLRKAEADDPLDTVSGTTGLTGAADTIAILSRIRGADHAELTVTGRDVEEKTLALEWDRSSKKWAILGDAEYSFGRTPERQQIIDLLMKAGRPMVTSEIAKALGKAESAVSNLLKKLIEGGLIRRAAYGKYTCCENDESDEWSESDESGES